MASANIVKEVLAESEKEVKKEDCPQEVQPLEEEATGEKKEDLESLDINAAIDKVLARLDNVTSDAGLGTSTNLFG